MEENSMRGPDLPHRRYSMPETVMRKFRLGQSSSSSSESSSRGSNRPRRHISRRKLAKPQYRVNRSSQTSPQVKCQSDSQCLSDQVLLPTSPSLSRQRASSFPDLSSSDEGKVYKCLRPISAGDRICGTPSPTQVSCYGAPGHTCDLCSNSWSYTSSDYTLSQTVSDRTTSTQDSTLSVKSTSPSTTTPTSFNSEKARMLENNIFAPSGNFIAVHTECLLIRPIEVSESSDNWRFGFSVDDEESRLTMMPHSIGTNTEDDIGAITSGKKERSTSIGEWPQPEPQAVMQLMIDKGTYMDSSAEYLDTSDTDKLTVVSNRNTEIKYIDVGVNTDMMDIAVQTSDEVEETIPIEEISLTTTIGVQVTENNLEEEESKDEIQVNASIGCQTNEFNSMFKIPHIKIFKSSTESQNTDEKYDHFESVEQEESLPNHQRRPRHTHQFTSTRTIPESNKQEKGQQTSDNILRSSKSFPPFPLCQHKYNTRSLDADVACSGSNYKDMAEADSVIARFSAVPRSNSMIVNTSSVDYTSDSDLSLTDSLEDIEHQERDDWPATRHDSRLVRGEVSLETDSRKSKKYAKGGDAYAYFLSITGEQDMIKQYPIPEWLTARLKKREEEIKKLFELKLNRNQTIIYRRRKRTIKKVENYTESNSTNSKDPNKRQKTPKSVKWECKNGDQEQVGSSSKRFSDKTESSKSTSTRVVDSNKALQVKQTRLSNEDKSKPPGEEGAVALPLNSKTDNNNYVHISEIIKIEMSNQLKTVITKEKQINLNHDAFIKDGRNIQTSEIINNEDAYNSQKIIMKTNVGQFHIDNSSTLIELEHKTNREELQPKRVREAIEDKEIKELQVKQSRSVEQEKLRSDSLEGEKSKKGILNKSDSDNYSFKDFKPLFQSKADDKTVAQILLAAMDDNKESEQSTVIVKSESKAVSTADSPFTSNQQQQTGESTEESEEEIKKMETIEKSCNTVYPYLSEAIQTTESFLESSSNLDGSRLSVDKDTETSESSENSPTPQENVIVTTDEKCINTSTFSVSTQVQTKESFQEDDKSFVEAPVLIHDKATGTFEEDKEEHITDTVDKSCNTMNPLVTSAVQTDNSPAINEVKPLIVSTAKQDKRNVQKSERKDQTAVNFNKKVSLAVEKSSRNKKETPVLYCKRTGQMITDDSKSPQVLELNVPPCSCHMCTLHKKSLAGGGPGAEKHKDFQTNSNNVKCRLQNRKIGGNDKKDDKKPTARFGAGRRNIAGSKFLRKFEVIPEEKNSSNESVTEEQIIPLDLTKDWKKSLTNKGTMTRTIDQSRPQLREAFVEFEKSSKSNNQSFMEMRPPSPSFEENEIVDKSKKGVQLSNKKSNLVFGRFRAVPDDETKTRETREGPPMLGEGLELVRQYKGRAALATTHVEGHDELMTLSKGWINFYLLKDSQDVSDAEEFQNWHNDGNSLHQVAPQPKLQQSCKIAEEKFKQYAVEIHATPEPVQPAQKGLILPNLPQRDGKKKSKGNGSKQGNVCLPEIHSSSSSSTPEHMNEKIVTSHLSSRKLQQQQQQLLPEVNGRRKSSRHEINTMREHVTAIEKLSAKTGVERDLEFSENALSTKAVEVARSEHSVSSITSSTVILSESPSPQQLQLPERKTHHKHQSFYNQPNNGMGASWTVTVAGSSGLKNQTPPDVEMKLSFAKPNLRNSQENSNPERSVMQYNAQHTSHISRSKRQGKMIEEYAHSLRNERHSLQYVPELSFQTAQQTKKERARSEPQQKDGNMFLDPDYSGPLSARSKVSMDGSEGSICSDLQVTGLAITPEQKPRVPTQSERDLVRRQRYKFTR